MVQVLLGLGSNRSYKKKDSVTLLAFACRKLKTLMQNAEFSSLYESKAMYVENQDNFINMAAKGFVEDNTDPFCFLDEINKIEAEFGRNRKKEIRFGPRPLDIDIESFGSVKLNTTRLTIPHPRIKERAFVLIPALEILTNSADSKIREEFSSFLEVLPFQQIEKCSEQKQLRFKELLES